MNNLSSMLKRLEWQGGDQEHRMIKDKYKTFLKTLSYSYQACSVSLVQKVDSCKQLHHTNCYRALINPDKVKQNYDDKILSIDYKSNYRPGDVFAWLGTGTHWIIYLRQLTEDAYFRGEIRLCQYKIKFKDSEGNVQETWAAIRGPVETQIQSIQKNQIRVNEPNLSLNILMPRNEKTLEAFNRYSEFLFKGRDWRVEAIDDISMEGILEISAEEYFIDRDTDDIEHEIKDGLVIEPVDPSPLTQIIGETFIKPKIPETYSYDVEGGNWSIVESNVPVEINSLSSTEIEVIWNKMTSGQFTLKWDKDEISETKTIVVESLF